MVVIPFPPSSYELLMEGEQEDRLDNLYLNQGIERGGAPLRKITPPSPDVIEGKGDTGGWGFIKIKRGEGFYKQKSKAARN